MIYITNYNNLFKEINNKINCAVENASNRILGNLQLIIDSEFYDVFEPEYYKRTYQFWKSATVKMLRKNCGQIYMDKSRMNYNSFWTAEKQLYAASIGSHGGWFTDESRKHKFWEVFIEFCELHAIGILKEELKKQGLSVY